MTVKQFPLHLVRKADDAQQAGSERQHASRKAEIIDISHRFGGDVVGVSGGGIAAPASSSSDADASAAASVHERRLQMARELVVSAEQSADIETEDELLSVSEDARKLLARRALSSGELLHKLMELGHLREQAEQEVEKCISRLYLDDAALAERLREKLRNEKGMSRTQIYLKMRERRLPQSVIDAALAPLAAAEEDELMRQAAHKRASQLGGLPFDVAERRLLGYLARRGWGGSAAREAVREALSQQQSEAHTVHFE